MPRVRDRLRSPGLSWHTNAFSCSAQEILDTNLRFESGSLAGFVLLGSGDERRRSFGSNTQGSIP